MPKTIKQLQAMMNLERFDLKGFHVVVDIGDLAMPCITGVRLDKENKRIIWLTDLSVEQVSVPGTEAYADDHPEITEAFDV